MGEALELFSSFDSRPAPWRPLLETLGIGGKEKSYVAKLSGGERRRVFIALALIHDRERLFLDELTTSLDSQACLAMSQVVRDIRRCGATVALTTPYMEEAEALCDRVAIIDHGGLVALGTVPELISAHTEGFTLQLTFDRPTPPTLASVDGVSSVGSDNGVTIVRGRGAFAQNALSHLTQNGFGRQGFVDATLPAYAALGMPIMGVLTLPVRDLPLRESGALLRMRATPLRRRNYVAADLTVNVLIGLTGIVFALLVGVVGPRGATAVLVGIIVVFDALGARLLKRNTA